MRDVFYTLLITALFLAMALLHSCGFSEQTPFQSKGKGAPCKDEIFHKATSVCGDFSPEQTSVTLLHGTNCSPYGHCLADDTILLVKCRVPNNRDTWGVYGISERDMLFNVYGQGMCVEVFLAQ